MIGSPAGIYFIVAFAEFLLLALSIRVGWVSISLPPDAFLLGQILAAGLILPSFAALSFATTPARARSIAFFVTGVPLAGLDLTLLACIRPISA